MKNKICKNEFFFFMKKTYEYGISLPVPGLKFWRKKISRLLIKLRILGKECPRPGGAKLMCAVQIFSTFFALTVKFGPNLDDKKQKKIYAGPKKFRVTALVRFQIFWEF